jgi:phosphoserine phosphatase
MPLMPGARETVLALRKAGYRVGIVSDSYRVAAEIVRRRVFADFAVAHLMRFRGGRCVGEVALSGALAHPAGCSQHTCCEVNLLHHLADRLGVEREEVLAVGDGENDICLLQAAGTSVAFRSTRARVRAAAQLAVEGALSDILPAVLPEPEILVAAPTPNPGEEFALASTFPPSPPVVRLRTPRRRTVTPRGLNAQT